MQRMKTLALCAMTLGVLLLLNHATTAVAQGPQHGHGKKAGFGQALGLSEEQQAKARAIFSDAHKKCLDVLTPAQREAMHARVEKAKGNAKSLNLTPEQKAQMQAIFTETRAQRKALRENTTLTPEQQQAQARSLRQSIKEKMRGVLTPEQLAQVQQGRRQFGRHTRHAGARLTSEQRQQLTVIRKDAMQEFRSVLTPEQQQKLDALHANRVEGRGGKRMMHGPGIR